jgi:hypothetical protein
MSQKVTFLISREHKRALDKIGRFLLTQKVDVENEKRAGTISHSAVLRYMIEEFEKRIANEGAKAHVINEAFLTGGNS